MLQAEENFSKKTRRFLLQDWSENAVMLYRQAARTLLYNLTMIMFYTMKGPFVPTSQTIIHLSQSSTPQFWEEGYIKVSNICFSLPYFLILFNVLHRILVYWRGQIWPFSSQHNIQGDWKKVNILESNSMGHCEKKASNECLTDSEELTREKYLNPAHSSILWHFSDALDDCLWGWMESEVYKRNVDTRDELLARVLDAAALMKISNRNSCKWASSLQIFAKFIKVDGGIFEIFSEL